MYGPNHTIQEGGAMNFFAIFQLPNGDIELVTPSLEGECILPVNSFKMLLYGLLLATLELCWWYHVRQMIMMMS